MRRHLALALILMVSTALAACNPTAATAPTPTAAPKATAVVVAPTATAPAATAKPVAKALTVDDLKNADYQLPDIGQFKLDNGSFSKEAAPGSASKLTVTFLAQNAFGDLNGDGVDDAAVILAYSGGGSGTFIYLVAVANQNGQPKQLAAESLGDRVKIESVAVKSGQAVVDLVAHGPSDPLCCPTQKQTRTYKVQGDNLVKV